MNCASLKNRREIREQGKPQIPPPKKKKKKKNKGVSLDKREKKKMKTSSDRRNIGELEAWSNSLNTQFKNQLESGSILYLCENQKHTFAKLSYFVFD